LTAALSDTIRRETRAVLISRHGSLSSSATSERGLAGLTGQRLADDPGNQPQSFDDCRHPLPFPRHRAEGERPQDLVAVSRKRKNGSGSKTLL
jgi:hypothetical protein